MDEEDEDGAGGDNDGEGREEGVVEFGEGFLSSGIDIISLVAFGKDIDSVTKGGEGEGSQMGEDIRRIMRCGLLRVLSPIPFWKIPFIGQYLDGGGFSIDRIISSFRRLVDEARAAGKSENDTFLSKVVDSTAETHLTPQRIIGNLLTMFIAGSETSAVTMTSLLYHIATDTTGLQDELAAEALAVQDFHALSLERISNEFPRLRSAIYETLRIAGPTPLLRMESREEHVEIGGVSFPPHTQFIVLRRYISTLPETTEDDGTNGRKRRATPTGPRNAPPTEYCPRRWLERHGDGVPTVSTDAPTYDRHGFTPFGLGVRVCPGRGLAEMEMAVVVASLLRRFEIRWTPEIEGGCAPMRLVSRFTEVQERPVRLLLRTRRG